jgi:hypothetical protein
MKNKKCTSGFMQRASAVGLVIFHLIKLGPVFYNEIT